MADRFEIPHDLTGAELPSRAPAETAVVRHEPDRVTRAAVTSAVVGAAAYKLLPAIFHLNTGGSQDELAAFYAAVATFLLASLKDARTLCWSEKQKKQEDAIQIAQGAGGGLIAGSSLAALTQAALLSWLDGGIMLGATILGGLGAAALNYARRVKHCPHCGQPAVCNQRVCRHCYRIFWPLTVELNCERHLTLSWFQIASYLQEQGLNYLDAEELLQRHGPHWGVFPQPRQLQVDCDRFADWVRRSKNDIVSVIGKGAGARTPSQIDQHLTSRGL